MIRIFSFFKNRKRPCREFTFTAFHSRVTETQVDYTITARSRTEAAQMLKLYLHELRNNTALFSHSISSQHHRRSYQTAYCLKTDCMREISADKLVRQFYRVEGHPEPVSSPSILRRLVQEIQKLFFISSTHERTTTDRPATQ